MGYDKSSKLISMHRCRLDLLFIWGRSVFSKIPKFWLNVKFYKFARIFKSPYKVRQIIVIIWPCIVELSLSRLFRSRSPFLICLQDCSAKCLIWLYTFDWESKDSSDCGHQGRLWRPRCSVCHQMHTSASHQCTSFINDNESIRISIHISDSFFLNEA